MRKAADLSAAVIARLQETWPRMRPGDTLVLEDAPSHRPSMRDAFGNHVLDAVMLATAASTNARYLPDSEDWSEIHLQQVGSPPTGREWRLRLGSSGDTILISPAIGPS
jgi:hypothetical protein